MKQKKLSNKQWIELIEQVKNGDSKAFEKLCQLKTASILFVSNSILHNWEDAEDATQEILLAMGESIKTLAAPEAFTSWLNRLSYNVCCSMRRKKMNIEDKTIPLEFTEEIYDPCLESCPDKYIEDIDSNNRIMQAVHSLPFHYRMAIIYHYYEGFTAPQIAEVMDISLAVAKNNLYRGRLALKEKIRQDNGFSQYIPLGIFLPLVFEQTDGAIAAKRSVSVLDNMGIPIENSSSYATAFKVVGTIAASGTLAAGIFASGIGLPVTLHKDTSINTASTLPAFSTPASSPNSPVYTFPTAPSTKPNTATIFSRSSTYNLQDSKHLSDSSPEPVSPPIVTQGNTVKGRIFLQDATSPVEQTPWSIPGAIVELYKIGDSEKPIQTVTTAKEPYGGWYSFDSLESGEYQIKVILPKHFTPMGFVDETMRQISNLNVSSIFTLNDKQTVTLHLPVYQQGNINGSIKPREDSVKNLLQNIEVCLYNSENQLIATTFTSKDGLYTFKTPPIGKSGKYSIHYSLPADLKVTLNKSTLDLNISTGITTQVETIYLSDTTPPQLQVELNNAPATNRNNAFTIHTTDNSPVAVYWAVITGDSVVAEGNSTSPGNQLNTLETGEYVLQVTASDRAGNTSKEVLFLLLQ